MIDLRKLQPDGGSYAEVNLGELDGRLSRAATRQLRAVQLLRFRGSLADPTTSLARFGNQCNEVVSRCIYGNFYDRV